MAEQTNAEKELNELLEQMQSKALMSMLGDIRNEGIERLIQMYTFMRTNGSLAKSVLEDPEFIDKFMQNMEDVAGSPSRASGSIVCALETFEAIVLHYEPNLERPAIAERLQEITTEYLAKK